MAYKLKRKKRIHSKEWKECVKKVQKKQTGVNPYAVCTASLGKKSFKSKRK